MQVTHKYTIAMHCPMGAVGKLAKPDCSHAILVSVIVCRIILTFSYYDCNSNLCKCKLNIDTKSY